VQYNVAQLLKGSCGAIRVFEVDEEPQFEIGGARLSGPIRGNVRLMRTQQGILVQAYLTVDAEMECSRCLKPARVTLETYLEEEFRSTIDINTGLRLGPQPDEIVDEEALIDAHHILHLDEAARQELEASLPLKPLCREACAGICPRCGSDLNQGPCGCAPEIDRRWEALRQMLNESAT